MTDSSSDPFAKSFYPKIKPWIKDQKYSWNRLVNPRDISFLQCCETDNNENNYYILARHHDPVWQKIRISDYFPKSECDKNLVIAMKKIEALRKHYCY